MQSPGGGGQQSDLAGPHGRRKECRLNDELAVALLEAVKNSSGLYLIEPVNHSLADHLRSRPRPQGSALRSDERAQRALDCSGRPQEAHVLIREKGGERKDVQASLFTKCPSNG